jgi:hypothetical protein
MKQVKSDFDCMQSISCIATATRVSPLQQVFTTFSPTAWGKERLCKVDSTHAQQ